MLSSLVTSVLTNSARLPSSSASALPLSSARSAITTPRPSACSRRTVASPRPPAPPLTIAEAPSNCWTDTSSPLSTVVFQLSRIARHQTPRVLRGQHQPAESSREVRGGAVIPGPALRAQGEQPQRVLTGDADRAVQLMSDAGDRAVGPADRNLGDGDGVVG